MGDRAAASGASSFAGGQQAVASNLQTTALGFQSKATGANDNIFEDPFGFQPGGTEAIFTLPNGMLGFIIADENDRIVEDSDILLDTNQNNFRAITSVSCANCHATGFIPVVDEVGSDSAIPQIPHIIGSLVGKGPARP